MKRNIAMACLLGFCSLALAQGPGPGGGPAGKGPGWRFNSGNTPGWSLMTPQERTEHRNKMLGLKSYEECKAYQETHHNQMTERAKEKGRPIPAAPRQSMCDRLKQARRIN